MLKLSLTIGYFGDKNPKIVILNILCRGIWLLRPTIPSPEEGCAHSCRY